VSEDIPVKGRDEGYNYRVKICHTHKNKLALKTGIYTKPKKK